MNHLFSRKRASKRVLTRYTLPRVSLLTKPETTLKTLTLTLSLISSRKRTNKEQLTSLRDSTYQTYYSLKGLQTKLHLYLDFWKAKQNLYNL